MIQYIDTFINIYEMPYVEGLHNNLDFSLLLLLPWGISSRDPQFLDIRQKEIERERDRYIYIYMYIYTHVHIHISISIYAYTHRKIQTYIYTYKHMYTGNIDSRNLLPTPTKCELGVY